MKNLRLGYKIAILDAVLIATAAWIAYVGVDRLREVNTQLQHVIDQTLRKRFLCSQIAGEVQASVREQKNASLSASDQESKEFAARSDEKKKEADEILKELRGLVDKEQNESENRKLREFDANWEKFKKIQEEILVLAVENTNTKARAICFGVAKEQLSRLLGLADQLSSESPDDASDEAKDANRDKRQRAAVKVARAALLIHDALAQHIDAINNDERERLNQQIRDLKDQTDVQVAAMSATGPADDLAAVAAIRSAFADFWASVEKARALSLADTNNRCIEMSLGPGKVASGACYEILDQLVAEFVEQGKRETDRCSEIFAASKRSVITATLAGVGISLALSYLVIRSVTVPITRTVAMTQAMAKGDLTQRVGLDQHDEVGKLAAATDAVAGTLSRIVSEIQQVSASVGGSASDLATVSERLVGQSREVSSQSVNVAAASEQLSSNITTMAASAEEMSMSVTSISSASEQMNVSVGTISSAARQTATNVGAVTSAITEISNSFHDVLSDAREGSKVAGDAVQLAGSATSTMQSLNRAGSEISKVTDTIKMIALQTNLLALNATIEATSAGEAGKGFAVVAHEIKQLANQSAKAAEDIAQKIEGVQQGTREAVKVIQSVTEIIDKLNESAGRITQSVERQTQAANTISANVDEANKGVGEIARSISEVAKASNDMSRNISEAATGANGVSRNVAEAASAAGGISAGIHNVSDAASETAASAAKVSEASEMLRQVATQLRELVSRFRTNARET